MGDAGRHRQQQRQDEPEGKGEQRRREKSGDTYQRPVRRYVEAEQPQHEKDEDHRDSRCRRAQDPRSVCRVDPVHERRLGFLFEGPGDSLGGRAPSARYDDPGGEKDLVAGSERRLVVVPASDGELQDEDPDDGLQDRPDVAGPRAGVLGPDPLHHEREDDPCLEPRRRCYAHAITLQDAPDHTAGACLAIIAQQGATSAL